MKLMPTFFKVMPIVITVLSFLMVSNIPYMSFKNVKLSRVRTIELFALMIVLIILVIVYPQNIFFIIFSIYAVSGMVFYIPKIILRKRNRKKNNDAENKSA